MVRHLILFLVFILVLPTVSALTTITQDGVTITSSKETYFCEPVIREKGCLFKTQATIQNKNGFTALGKYGIEASEDIILSNINDGTSSLSLEKDQDRKIETGNTFELLSGQKKTVDISFFASKSGKFNITFHFGSFSAVLDPFFNVTINASSPSLYLQNGSVDTDQDFNFGNATEISTELNDDLDATDFLITRGGLLNNTINFTDGSAENTQFLTSTGEMFEVNFTILDTSAITNLTACFRASTGSGADDPNLTINQQFTGILLDFPTGNSPTVDTCFNIPIELLSNGSQLIGMGCTSCGNPVSQRNYLDTDVNNPDNTSFFFDGVTLNKVTVEDYFINFIIETDTEGFAIRVNFNHTLDSENQYFLRTRMTTPTVTDANVHRYINETDIDPGFVTQALMTGENAIILDPIIVNQSNATFRLYTESIARISEISLIEGINDTQNPIIQNCAVNTTLLTCGDSVRMSCNVTDDNFLNNVYFFWDDLTSNNEVVNRILNTDIFFKDVTYNHNTSGATNIFNFTSANATDQVGNFAIEAQTLQFNYSCGELFDTTPPQVTHINLLLGFNLTTIDKTTTNLSVNASCFDENAHEFSISMFNSSTVVFNLTNSTLNTNTNLTIRNEIDLTSVAVGSYTGHSICIDNSSNIAFREETIIINDFSPIELISPLNNSLLSFFDNPTELGNVDFSFLLSQESTCSILFNGTVQETSLLPSGTVSISSTFPENATVLWNVSCITESSSIEIPSPFHILTVERIPVVQALSLRECPTTTAGVLLLWLMVGISFFLIGLSLAHNKGFLGIFGSLLLIVTSWYISPCVAFFALILALMGMFLLVWFVLSNLGFKNQTFN